MNLFFDLDGTLFQTAKCDISAVNRIRNELGLPILPDDRITKSIGKKTKDFLSDLFPNSVHRLELTQRFRDYEHTEVMQHGTLFPGVETMLKTLKQKGHKLFICSNGSTEYIDLVLNTTGIHHLFQKIYSAKSYVSKVEMIKNVMEEQKSQSPFFLVIGDTLSDIDAGYQNSIPTIAASYGYGSSADYEKATFIAKSAEEIISCMEQCHIFFETYFYFQKKECRILGINGVDTSGKTMFTNAFARFLLSIGKKVQIIHMDDFHNPSRVRLKGENEIEAYYANAFNYSQVIDDLLKPVRHQEIIDKDICCLQLDTDQYTNKIHFFIDHETIVLLEGVLLFRPPLQDYLDGRIFIDITFEEVLKRAEIRDVPIYGEKMLLKYQNKYIPIQKKYIDEFHPERLADLVIDNNDYQKPRIRHKNR